VEALASRLTDLFDAADRSAVDASVARYAQQGVPRELAVRVAASDALYAALDIVEVAESTQRPVELVARIHFELATRLGLPWLHERITALPGEAHWETLAKAAMLDDLSGVQRTITAEILAGGDSSASPDVLIQAWQDRNDRAIERAARLLGELRAVDAPDASMLSVALRELRALA